MQTQKDTNTNINLENTSLIKDSDGRKLNPKTTSLFMIANIFTNGRVKIKLSEHVAEQMNIRKILPYKLPKL